MKVRQDYGIIKIVVLRRKLKTSENHIEFSVPHHVDLNYLGLLLISSLSYLIKDYQTIVLHSKNSRFRYEGKAGEERKSVTFKDIPLKNHANRELSTRPFH